VQMHMAEGQRGWVFNDSRNGQSWKTSSGGEILQIDRVGSSLVVPVKQ
jgi:hypothetical protein